MPKTEISQSEKRFLESLGALFNNQANFERSCLFLKSSTDQGVIRNGGRNGARFAPQSLLATFKKFSQTPFLKKMAFFEEEVSSSEEELMDFHKSQEKESQMIEGYLKKFPQSFVCHIGGGHDHIFPFLSALAKNYSEIVVINIDAHADTRDDLNFHSGTPFRQFANSYAGIFSLFQVGLHPFANTESTLAPLEKGAEKILWSSELSEEKIDSYFKEIESVISSKTAVVFSLDCDALSGSIVPGVSAVNPNGIPLKTLRLLWKKYQSLPMAHSPLLGVYELNPLYDTLASLSMRTVGSFIFDCLNKR